MKTYLIIFKGYYLEGSMLTIDSTPQQAFGQVINSLKRMGLYEVNKNLTIDDLKRINIDEPQVVIINNGDY